MEYKYPPSDRWPTDYSNQPGVDPLDGNLMDGGLRAADQLAGSLQAELSREREHNRMLREQIRQHEERARRWQSQGAQLHQQAVEARRTEEVAAKYAKSIALEAERLREELTRAQKKIAQLEVQAAKTSVVAQENEKLREKANHIENELRAHYERAEQENSRYLKTLQTFKEAQEKAQVNEQKLEEMQALRQSLEARAEILVRETESARAESTKAKRELAELKAELTQVCADRNQAREQMMRLEGEAARWQAEQARWLEAQSSLADLQARLKAYDDEAIRLEEQVGGLIAELTRQADEQEKMAKQFEQACECASQWERKAMVLREECGTLQELLRFEKNWKREAASVLREGRASARDDAELLSLIVDALTESGELTTANAERIAAGNPA